MTDRPIRLLIADDHTIVRKGLCSLLDAERYGFTVVGEAANGEEAVSLAETLKPDVILMDVLMPKKSGVEAIREICKRDPNAKVLVLTSFDEQANVAKALSAGALGYLLKDSSPDELIQAIRSVSLGQLTVPGHLARAALLNLPSTESVAIVNTAEPVELTERELDVLRILARGWSNRQIADALFITTFTVRSHVRNILRKLNLSNRTQAAMYATERGLAAPNPNANVEL